MTTEAPITEVPPNQDESRRFRRALGHYPTGVAVITTVDENGRPIGLTCNSFSSVSLEPRLVLWSLQKTSRSLAIFQQSKMFAINVLSGTQQHLSTRFASSKIADKFSDVAIQIGGLGLPLLQDCVATFECSLYAEHDAGDHVVFIGRVEKFEAANAPDPIVFCQGAYKFLEAELENNTAEAPESVLLDARQQVYQMLVRLACARATDNDLKKLEDCLLYMERLAVMNRHDERARQGIQFFFLIAASAHNDVLLAVAETLTKAIDEQRASAPHGSGYVQELVPLRWDLLTAIRAKDERRASRVVREYLSLMQQKSFSQEINNA